MPKTAARLLVGAIALAAAILACQLPGSAKPAAQPSATAQPAVAPATVPSATTLGAAAASTRDAQATTDAANVQATIQPTDNPEQYYTKQAQTAVAETATAKAAAGKAKPKSVVMQTGQLPHMLTLALDAKGGLHLFDQAPASDGASANLVHQQLGSDGNWSQPQVVAANVEVAALAAEPDPGGTMCVLWGGQSTGGGGVTGVFQSCPNTDGTWPAVTDPIAKPLTAGNVTIAALAYAQSGAAGALTLNSANGALALFFSPIDLQASHAALKAVPVSKDVPVLSAALAIDSHGGLHALWLDSTGGTAYSVEASDSADKGQTWSAPQKLYAGTADNPSQVTIQLAADTAGHVHALWDGDHKIFYQGWTAGSWGDVVQLSGDDRRGQIERLAVTADGLARAVWTSINGNTAQIVASAQSADGTWSPAEPVADDRGLDQALCVDASGANHIVWTGQADMRYATWTP